MNETILNIYLIINNDLVVEFRAIGYEMEGGDDNKIKFLKSKAVEDFSRAYRYDAPTNKKGKFMPYKKFSKLEKRGRQFELFEEMFSNFDIPQNPLICVTPVLNGKILASE
jgi:actin-related protein